MPRVNERSREVEASRKTSCWTDEEVVAGRRSAEEKTKKNFQGSEGKPPAEINALFYTFQSSFQISARSLYSIPLPIVTCFARKRLRHTCRGR